MERSLLHRWLSVFKRGVTVWSLHLLWCPQWPTSWLDTCRLSFYFKDPFMFFKIIEDSQLFLGLCLISLYLQMFVLLETRLINFRHFCHFEVAGINGLVCWHKQHLRKDRSVRQKPKTTEVLHFCLFTLQLPSTAGFPASPACVTTQIVVRSCVCQGAFAACPAFLRDWGACAGGVCVCVSVLEGQVNPGISVMPGLCL